MPTPKNRGGRRSSRARETQAAQREAGARRQTTLRRYRFLRAAGWSLVGVAVATGVSHWLSHLQLWSFASQGVMDLVAGYPMALLLGIAGSIVLSKA